jgi:hypothetical protein
MENEYEAEFYKSSKAIKKQVTQPKKKDRKRKRNEDDYDEDSVENKRSVNIEFSDGEDDEEEEEYDDQDEVIIDTQGDFEIRKFVYHKESIVTDQVLEVNYENGNTSYYRKLSNTNRYAVVLAQKKIYDPLEIINESIAKGSDDTNDKVGVYASDITIALDAGLSRGIFTAGYVDDTKEQIENALTNMNNKNIQNTVNILKKLYTLIQIQLKRK